MYDPAEVSTSPRFRCRQPRRTALGASGDAPSLIERLRMPSQAHSTDTPQSSSSSAVRAAAACDEVRRTAIAYKLPVPPPRVCEELCVEVERVATVSARSMNTLRAAVERFTAALRDDGASPEAVLIVLKKVVNSRAFIASGRGDEIGGEELRQRISTWSIDEFFRERKG